MDDQAAKSNKSRTYVPKNVEGAPLPGPYKVREGDQLYIRVVGYDEETTTIQLINGAGTTVGGEGGQAGLAFTTYTVDGNGQVDVPLIGKLQAKGKTLAEIRADIDKELKAYVQNASSRVHLGNFKVTMMGEVGAPGFHYIYEEQINILEALALAGNPTVFADLKHVKILREANGEFITAYVNIGSSKLPSNDFFYLHPNDVIIVEPVKAKAAQINGQTVSTFISTISVAAVLANLTLNIIRTQ